MGNALIVSVVQFNPRLAKCHADVIDNFRKLKPLISQAHDMGTNFLVFPELCLTGYSFLNLDEAMLVAENQNGPTFRFMQNVAVNMKSYVSWGYVRIDPKTRRLHNSATMISPQGEIISCCDKINLFSTDFLWSKPGIEPAPIVQTDLGLLSVVICRDLRDKIPKNIPRLSSDDSSIFNGKKVDVVAACVNWGKGGFPSTSWMDFVADNSCVLAVANRWGKEANGSFSQNFGQGGSAIIEPNWTIHTGGLKFNADCVVTAYTGGSI
jgi:predicted amidohydrolase